MMLGVYQTTNANHAEHLRQAYGFQPDSSSVSKIIYPVGVRDMDYSGWSTFHHASASNDTSVLSDIINQEGFDHMEGKTEFVDGHQFTPLLCACKGNAVQTFEILVSNGADVTATDSQGNGVVEVSVLFRSTELFQHLLEHGYHLDKIRIWEKLLSMLFSRESEDSAKRLGAMEMMEALVHKDPKYISPFIDNGGLNAIKDILMECIDSPKSQGGNRLRNILSDEEKQQKNVLYARCINTLHGLISYVSDAQGNLFVNNYNDVITLLLRLHTKGCRENGSTVSLEEAASTATSGVTGSQSGVTVTVSETKLAGQCLLLIAGNKAWGLPALIKTNTISNLLRSVLLEGISSQPFRIIETAYQTDPQEFLRNVGLSEIEIILTILHTEKKLEIKQFFIHFLIDLFKQERSKHHLYNQEVIGTLLSELDSPNSSYNRSVLLLLLSIAEQEPAGLQAIFKSTNSFAYLVNRVLLETEDRFDMCCRLLWMLVRSFSDIQDSVKVVENIGMTTVVRMLDSEDLQIQCIGCEAVGILLSSDKFDYHAQLIRRDVHNKMINLLTASTAGHVLYSAMTSLAKLALSWSSFHPVPAVQNAILQSDSLPRLVQIAQNSRFTSAALQSAAFLLIASVLLGNLVTEKRLAEEDINIEEELKKQTKHTEQSLKDAIRATSIFRYHALILDNASYKYDCALVSSQGTDSLFNDILGALCKGEHVEEQIVNLLKHDNKYTFLATLAKLRGCGDIVAERAMEDLIAALYTGSPQVRESAATALAALSYYPSGREQLLLQHHEDPMLLETVSEHSVHIPLCDTFLESRAGSTVRDHRRRQLRKTIGNSVAKLPDIGTNTIYDEKKRLKTPTREGKKTPAPGDKMMSKMETVLYREISNMGLSRPYSKVGTLPPLLLSPTEKPVSTSHDRSLYTTVDRVYRKLYLRANAAPGTPRPATSHPPRDRQSLARNLSFVF